MSNDICRPGCGACCIAPSITTAIPGHPEGKPAGQPCHNLDLETYACRIWQQPHYPGLCTAFKPCADVCGDNREQALETLHWLEQAT